jgi:hypothetical protein
MTDVEHSPGMPDTGERREITHFVNCEGSRTGSRVEEVGFENKTAIRKSRAPRPFSQATECFVEPQGKASRNRRSLRSSSINWQYRLQKLRRIRLKSLATQLSLGRERNRQRQTCNGVSPYSMARAIAQLAMYRLSSLNLVGTCTPPPRSESTTFRRIADLT